jgi:hypothetical protein
MDSIARRKAAQQARFGTVVPPDDVSRIIALPRSPAVPVFDISRKLRPNATGIALRPVQQQALDALAATGGLLGVIGVGHGKSYIALLAGLAVNADNVIVLVSPATVPYMQKLLEDLCARYHMPKVRIVSWGNLSSQEANELLTEWSRFMQGNALLVADEAHFARNFDAARTRRLRVWLDYHPHVKFVALSGTMTTRRMTDFAWLAARALGAASPVPTGEQCGAWDRVLANDMQSPADFGAVRPLLEWAGCQDIPQKVGMRLTDAQQQTVREAFAERLRTCPGVVLTQGASCDASLYLSGMPIWDHALRNIRKRAEEIARTYRDPAGVELADEAEVARTAKRLSLGYYYQWAWPNNKPDYEWMEKRQAWARKCRWLIENYARAGFDTRGLVENEARKLMQQGSQAQWVQTYADWAAIENRAAPIKAVTWVDDHPLREIVAWARRYAPCLIWYDEEAVADKLDELGVQVYYAGEQIDNSQCANTVALSVTAHGGSGLNLQGWSRQVFTCVPSNGATWEQVLGRTHRQGQQSDEVWAWVPQYTAPLRRALEQARRDASWIETSTGNKQKLLLATVLETCPTSGRVVAK